MPHTHRHDTRYKASQGEGAQANTEANIEVPETQPTTEMEAAINNNLENQQEGTPLAESEQPKQTERITQTGDTDFQEWMKKVMEVTYKNIESLKEDNKKSREENQKNMESLNKKMDENSKALKEDSQRNIESLKEDLNKKLDDNSQKMEEKMDDISKKNVYLLNKYNILY